MQDFPLEALGSGSDYSSFLQHLGIPALNLEFSGEDRGGEYHTAYDSYDNYVRFKDRNFDYGLALAKIAGRVVLRLAQAEVLPFEFKGLHKAIAGYAAELLVLTNDMREDHEIENRLINEGKYQQAADPSAVFYVPRNKTVVPLLDFENLHQSINELAQAAEKIDLLRTQVLADKKQRARLNELIYLAERQLINTAGLPQRPWYKHILYAPGLYTGYSAKTLPGIREAIEQADWFEANRQIESVAAQIKGLTDFLNAAVNGK